MLVSNLLSNVNRGCDIQSEVSRRQMRQTTIDKSNKIEAEIAINTLAVYSGTCSPTHVNT